MNQSPRNAEPIAQVVVKNTFIAFKVSTQKTHSRCRSDSAVEYSFDIGRVGNNSPDATDNKRLDDSARLGEHDEACHISDADAVISNASLHFSGKGDSGVLAFGTFEENNDFPSIGSHVGYTKPFELRQTMQEVSAQIVDDTQFDYLGKGDCAALASGAYLQNKGCPWPFGYAKTCDSLQVMQEASAQMAELLEVSAQMAGGMQPVLAPPPPPPPPPPSLVNCGPHISPAANPNEQVFYYMVPGYEGNSVGHATAFGSAVDMQQSWAQGMQQPVEPAASADWHWPCFTGPSMEVVSDACGWVTGKHSSGPNELDGLMTPQYGLATGSPCNQEDALEDAQAYNAGFEAARSIAATCNHIAGYRPLGEPLGRMRQLGQEITRQLEKTTMVIKNIPNNYTRTMFLELLDSLGFACLYDFVYLPMDFRRHANLGYAFVNAVSPQNARHMKERLQGFKKWAANSYKVCQVSWGEPLQGLEAHIERYRHSPIMHDDVPEEFKPALFSHGLLQPFPPPTKPVRVPRLKLR